MFSEAMHSGADVLNQALLFYGLRRSRQKSDGDHPYGYGFETYVWSMVSAVGSFFLGAGACVYHGAQVHLRSYPNPSHMLAARPKHSAGGFRSIPIAEIHTFVQLRCSVR